MKKKTNLDDGKESIDDIVSDLCEARAFIQGMKLMSEADDKDMIERQYSNINNAIAYLIWSRDDTKN